MASRNLSRGVLTRADAVAPEQARDLVRARTALNRAPGSSVQLLGCPRIPGGTREIPQGIPCWYPYPRYPRAFLKLCQKKSFLTFARSRTRVCLGAMRWDRGDLQALQAAIGRLQKRTLEMDTEKEDG